MTAGNLFKFLRLADFLGFLDLARGLASTPQHLVELSYGLSQHLATLSVSVLSNYRNRPLAI
jgi:hypothetical protein